MTIILTLSDELYQCVVEMAVRHNRQWNVLPPPFGPNRSHDGNGLKPHKRDRERFLAVMDKVSDTEPAP